MEAAQKISQRDARKLFIRQQGLLRDNEFGRGKNATRKAIERLSYVQIDTISVVNRAHEHVLNTRVPNYNPSHLDKLVKERSVFEYWSHAAAFLPFEDYRFSLPVMQGWKSSRECDRKLAGAIIDRIRAEGPLQSRDFEDTRGDKRGGWWEWKPAKKVLEHLFLAGDLMVTRRDGFQKVFDLKENVIPDHVNTSEPTIEEWSRFIVLRMIEALGVANEYDIGYAKSTIRRLSKIALKHPIRTAIEQLLEDDQLVPVTVQGQEYYTMPHILEALPVRVSRNTVRLLSPFDNLVINRKRGNALFNFDYVIECYLPAEKRKYGYFALPLLYGDELVGRLDAKADRKTLQLEVRNLVLEPGVNVDDRLLAALADGVARFATDHNCDSILIQRTEPADILKPVTTSVEQLL